MSSQLIEIGSFVVGAAGLALAALGARVDAQNRTQKKLDDAERDEAKRVRQLKDAEDAAFKRGEQAQVDRAHEEAQAEDIRRMRAQLAALEDQRRAHGEPTPQP